MKNERIGRLRQRFRGPMLPRILLLIEDLFYFVLASA